MHRSGRGRAQGVVAALVVAGAVASALVLAGPVRAQEARRPPAIPPPRPEAPEHRQPGRIQDVFNHHGVQIMSPHYRGDPAVAKVVPEARWHEPPAARTDGAGASRTAAP
jgi:hypothetical protein